MTVVPDPLSVPVLENRRGGRARWVLPLLIVAGALVTVWRDRGNVNTDGLSYLDLATAVGEGRWRDATSAYWSPLYPWLLGGWLALLQPGPAHELIAVRGLHLLIFAAAMLAFRAFLREWELAVAPASPAPPGSAADDSERIATRWIGWAGFAWATQVWVDAGTLSPDLLVAALFLAATSRAMRLRRESLGVGGHVGFGVLLALGYLGKAAVLPFAPFFLGVAYVRNRNASLKQASLAVLAFVVVAAPHVAAMHTKTQRFTTGDVGKLAYAWLVLGVREVHWQGDEPGTGTPAHPTRRIHTSPEAFEFDGPVAGTYPPWFDKSYWNEGVRIWVDPAKQVAAWRKTAEQIAWTAFRRTPIALAVAAFLLVAFLRAPRAAVQRLRPCLPAVFPSVVALSAYACVHVEGRYVAIPLLILALTVFRSVGVLTWKGWSRLGAGGLVPSAALVAVSIVAIVGGTFLRSRTIEIDDTNTVLAEALAAHGVPRGAKISTIGGSWGPYWARRAGVRVVAEVRPDGEPSPWSLDASASSALLTLLASKSDGWVVALDPPEGVTPPGWIALGSTRCFLWRAPR